MAVCWDIFSIIKCTGKQNKDLPKTLIMCIEFGIVCLETSNKTLRHQTKFVVKQITDSIVIF